MLPQTNELSSCITTIETSDTGSAILQDIYKEAEESGEGREVLKEIWRESQDKAMFFHDQKHNSKLFRINSVSILISFDFRNGIAREQVELDIVQNWLVSLRTQ